MSKENLIIPPLADEAGVVKVWAFSQNADGSLSPSASVGPSSNVNIEYLLGSVPALANPLPVELSDGNQAFGTVGNPLNVNVVSGGGGGGSNASVGLTGASAPASATEIGLIDGAGKLQGVSATSPLPVSLPAATVTTLTPPTAAAIGAACPVPPTAAAIGAACPVPPTAAAIGAACPVPPTAAAIGAACPVPPTAADIATAIVSNPPTVPLASGTITSLTPPTAAAIGAACPVPPTAAAIGAACPVPPTAADIAAAIVSNPPTTFGGAITGTVSAKLEDGSGNAITSTGSALDVNIKSGLASPLPVHDSSPASQAVTNAGTFAVQDSAAELSLASIVSALTNPLPVSLPAGTITTLTPPTAAAIGAACPVPPTAAAIAAAFSNPLPVSLPAGTITTLTPPTAAAIGAACPVPPTAAAIGAACPVPPTAAAIAAAFSNPLPVSLPAATVTSLTPPTAAAIGAACPVPPTAAAIAAALSNPLPVHDSSPASQAVTNAGTFAVQATTKTALTPAAPTATSVGITSASAVAANANRKGLVLTNTSGGTISLGFGSAAVLNSGITLFSGGSFEMDEYTFYAGAVYAIASGAASNLAIQEYST